MKKKLNEKNKKFLYNIFEKTIPYQTKRIITREIYYIKGKLIPKGSILEISYPKTVKDNYGNLILNTQKNIKYCTNCSSALPSKKTKECPYCGEKI